MIWTCVLGMLTGVWRTTWWTHPLLNCKSNSNQKNYWLRQTNTWSELAGWRGEVKYIRQTIIIGLTMDSNMSSSAITKKVNWSHSEMQRLNSTVGCYPPFNCAKINLLMWRTSLSGFTLHYNGFLNKTFAFKYCSVIAKIYIQAELYFFV